MSGGGSAAWRPGAWVLAGALAVAGVGASLACAPEEPGSDDEGETEAPPPPPRFESSALEISANYVGALSLEVGDLRDDTWLEIDGRRLQLLDGPAGEAPVRVDDERVELPVFGSLLAGDSELVLVHEHDGERLSSAPLTLTVLAVDPGEPTVSLDDEVVGAGAGLVAGGRGDGSVLALVEDGLARAWLSAEDPEQGWATQGLPTQLSLPGLSAPAPGERWPLALGRVELASGSYLLAVWIADERALLQAFAVGEQGQIDAAGLAAPRVIWDLDDGEQQAALGSVEWTGIEAVALLGTTAVVELWAPRDVEDPTPGDHLLVTRPVRAGDEGQGEPELGPTQLVYGPGLQDLELPAPLVEPRPGVDPRLSLWVAGLFPAGLRVVENGAVQLADAPIEAATLPGPLTGLRLCEGSLGARHAFAHSSADLRLELRWIDRWQGQALGVSVDLDEPATGPAAALGLAGLPGVLLPFGVDAPVQLWRSKGEGAALDKLPELGCDAIAAFDPGPLSLDDPAPSQLELACLAGGELRMGALGVEP